MGIFILDNGHYQGWARTHWEFVKNDCATDGVKMQITLNIYEWGFKNEKHGKAFEPHVWHRSEFLQKNFIRFFSPEYMVEDLYVVVPSIENASMSFSFEHRGQEIVVTTAKHIVEVF